MHATAYCPRHGDPFPSACLSCLSFNLCCADKGPRQGLHAQAHPCTPTGKGRVLRGAFSSTAHTGTGTGSAGGSGTTQINDKFESIKAAVAVFGTMVAVSGSTAVAVHHLDQTEIKLAKADVARIEGDRMLSEQHWKTEVERYKQDLNLAHTQDYAPYQAAILEKRKKRGGTGRLQKEEEKN